MTESELWIENISGKNTLIGNKPFSLWIQINIPTQLLLRDENSFNKTSQVSGNQ